jgi:hypothetical protein
MNEEKAVIAIKTGALAEQQPTLFEITELAFTSTIEEIYESWQTGDIQAQEALNLYAKIIGPLQEQERMVKALDQLVREKVSLALNCLEGPAVIPGFGKFEFTNPSISYSYDKKAVDRLCNELRTEGLGDVAARLDLCLKPSERVGTLKITREKSKD